MLSDRLINLRDAIKARCYCLTEENLRTIVGQLTYAAEDAKVLEMQVVSEETQNLPYPSNVIDIAAILHRHGIRAGVDAATNDEGGAA